MRELMKRLHRSTSESESSTVTSTDDNRGRETRVYSYPKRSSCRRPPYISLILLFVIKFYLVKNMYIEFDYCVWVFVERGRGLAYIDADIIEKHIDCR
jgi:hypothetical protein